MPIGTELREARVRSGLSVEQVSERINFQVHKIEALERDSYENFPSSTSLESIIRAYASAVGLDAAPLVERARRERAAFGGWQTPEDLQAFRTEHTSAIGAPASRTTEPSRAAVTDARRGDRRAAGDRVVFDHARADQFSPDADAVRQLSRRRPGRSTRRPGQLALIFVSVLAAVGWGAYLSRVARQTDRNPAAVRSTSGAESARADAEAAREGQARMSDPRGNDQATPANPTSTAGVDPQRTDPRPPSAAPDISGSWVLTTRVESSSLARFSGLQLGYELQLRQTGTRVTGSGRKISENNKPLSGRARTRLTVEGTMQDDRLALTFTERGARRPTRGNFNLLIDDSGTMSGRFSSDAAKSSGSVEAHRGQ